MIKHILNWLEKVPEVRTEVLAPPVKKASLPKYYSVTKQDYEYIGAQYTSGKSFYIIRADIFDRDTRKQVGDAAGYFQTLDDIEAGLVSLQEKIKEKIEELYKLDAGKEKAIAVLKKADEINNGLEWFYKK